MADLLACLYWETLKIDPSKPEWSERDRFILSKGHGAAIFYAALAERGFFPVEELDTYCQSGSILNGHATSGVPGVEVSSGSLGHGLPIGCGIALAQKRAGLLGRVFVMLSDGELDEGSNWEAFLFAPQHNLDNLIAIVDYNKIQAYGRTEDVMDLEPLSDKFKAFRWEVREIDGHNIEEISTALSAVPLEKGRPSLILAHTVKGKGVSFMEDSLAWHYKCPNDEETRLALEELRVSS
jgi:transketolase